MCACVSMRICASLSSSAPPRCCPLSAPPTVSAEVSWVLAPSPEAGSCCQCTSCVLLLSSGVTMCFARLAIWACTAACSVFGGRPWCQASLPVKTSWVVQIPRHLGWCYGQVTSSSLQPPVLFCVEHNWYSRCFWCENYEETEQMAV